jgi:hypothetical protein
MPVLKAFILEYPVYARLEEHVAVINPVEKPERNRIYILVFKGYEPCLAKVIPAVKLVEDILCVDDIPPVLEYHKMLVLEQPSYDFYILHIT